MSRSRLLIAIALVVSVLVAACGDAAEEPTDTTQDSPGTTQEGSDTTEGSTDTTQSPDTTEGPAEPIKVGFIVPQTGVYATIGTDIQRGMDTYLELNGDTLGGRPIELVTVDEGDSTQTGTAAARRLIEEEQVSAVVGTVNTATALAIAPMFAEAEIPVISTAEVYDQPYWFMSAWTNPMMNDSMVSHLSESLSDSDSVFLIASDYAQGHNIIEGVGSGLEDAGVAIAGTSFTPFGSTEDYQPFLSEILNSGATTVYAFYAGGEAIRFVTQYSEFGVDDQATLYGNQALTEGVLPAQGVNAVGVITNSTYVSTIDSELNEEFVNAYVTAFEAQPSVYSEAIFASMTALNQAVGQADASDGASIRDAIATMGDIESPRGTWHFDDFQGPTQTVYLREAVEADGGVINEVIDTLGVFTSEGEMVQE